MIEALASTALTPLILGGIISPLQLGLMVLFLFTSTGIFVVVRDELEFTKALGVAGGVYLFTVIWTYLLL